MANLTERKPKTFIDFLIDRPRPILTAIAKVISAYSSLLRVYSTRAQTSHIKEEKRRVSYIT